MPITYIQQKEIIKLYRVLKKQAHKLPRSNTHSGSTNKFESYPFHIAPVNYCSGYASRRQASIKGKLSSILTGVISKIGIPSIFHKSFFRS